MHVSNPLRHVLVLAALAGSFVVFAAASCDESLPTMQATLLAPPAVPPPIPGRAHVVVNLEAVEKKTDIAPNVQYTVWTFNGSVPGPLIRVRAGDDVEVRLKNDATNAMTHSIDLHAVNGPDGGAAATSVAPGQERAFQFRATTPGLYVYHCASGIVADHIANGMYGGILVDPVDGLPHADREYYVGQNEFYTTGDTGDTGPQQQDTAKLLAESPTYVTFNGNTKSLTGDHALPANTGDRVRLFLVNGGPNLISSFHVIGEIFDHAYEYGSLESPQPMAGVQTLLAPPGGAAVVDFTVDVPGDYKLVDHAIERVTKGAVGILHVEGRENPDIFHPLTTAAGAGAGQAAATPTPASVPTSTNSAGTASPTAGASSAPAGGTTLAISMKDLLFEPKDLTVSAGQKVVFKLTNEGQTPHNMRIAAANGNFEGAGNVVSSPDLVTPGKQATLEWQAPNSPGTFKFRCDFHPDQMVGTITVK
jgi:nitrite reductase (NO-forming)